MKTKVRDRAVCFFLSALGVGVCVCVNECSADFHSNSLQADPEQLFDQTHFLLARPPFSVADRTDFE